jgi:iron complex transport system substrate-binding protein
MHEFAVCVMACAAGFITVACSFDDQAFAMRLPLQGGGRNATGLDRPMLVAQQTEGRAKPDDVPGGGVRGEIPLSKNRAQSSPPPDAQNDLIHQMKILAAQDRGASSAPLKGEANKSELRDAAIATPRRIVSLNLCTDQLLLLLAPERIAALSILAADPLLSVMAAEARRHPLVRGDAEEVLRFKPDLILAAPFAARSTVDLLRRLQRPVLMVELSQDVEGLKRALRHVGSGIGATSRAELAISALDSELSSVSPVITAVRPSALIMNFGGLPSGPGSLADTALRLAGYRNGAADYVANAAGSIPLEAIVARPPDLLVLGQTPGDYRTVRADNLRHPALAALLRTTPHTALPQNLTLCATPQLTRAIRILAAHWPEAARQSAKRRSP